MKYTGSTLLIALALSLSPPTAHAQKISELDPLSTAATGDLLPVVDVSDTTQAASGSTKHMTVGTLRDFLADYLDGATLTLTGKTISGASNTLSNIGNSSLTNSGLTLGSTSISLGATQTTLAGLSSVTSTSFVGALTGNASTATALATARNINGVAFDGTGNITVAAAAGTLTGTTLASNVVTSSLTSVGTLTGGATGSGFTMDFSSSTVAGTVPPANLGSGSSITTKFLRGDGTWQTIAGGGDALTSNPLSQFAATTSAQLRGVLSDESGTGNAYFQGGDLGTPSAGVMTNATGLPINTGLTIASQAQGDILYYNGSNWTRLVAGTSGHFLQTQGAGANPQWAAGGGAPDSATYITQTADGTLINEQALSALATGLVKNTTATGVLSIAAAGTDYEVPLSFSTGLTRSTNTVTVNTTQNIAKLSNLSTNGRVTTSGGDGTLAVDTSDVETGGIYATIDGGGSAITTGVKGFVRIPYACTIQSVTLLADQSGSAVVDVWRDSYANYPPTDADSITASAVPAISSGVKSEDATLTGWSTSVSAGDVIGLHVDSASSITRLHVIIRTTR